MAHPITITDANFEAEVLLSKVPVLVDFWASWCSPCKLIAPILEDLTTLYEGRIKIGKVDVDANPLTPGTLGIMSIPTLIVFQGGTAADRIVGYQPLPALRARLDAILTPAR
jgi:thioredoxin 1